MKKIAFIFLSLIIFSCGKEKHNLTIKTHIKGLKKGTVYLKSAADTVLVTIDSVIVKGNSSFELHANLEEPDLFFLDLDKNSKEEDRIRFFADKGVIEINTTLKNFVTDVSITGSKHQKILEDYQKLMSRLNNRNLDLIKESFEAGKTGDTTIINSVAKKQNSLFRNRYLQTVNFALNHGDSEVAPYLALSEIYDVNNHLLDTIYKSLTPKIKDSKYGKELLKFLDERKTNEEKQKKPKS